MNQSLLRGLCWSVCFCWQDFFTAQEMVAGKENKTKRTSKHFPFKVQFLQYSPQWSFFHRQMNKNNFRALWCRCALIISVHNWIFQDTIYSVRLRVVRYRNGYWGYFRAVQSHLQGSVKALSVLDNLEYTVNTHWPLLDK